MCCCASHMDTRRQRTLWAQRKERGTVLGQGWVGGGALEAFVAKEMTGLSLEC